MPQDSQEAMHTLDTIQLIDAALGNRPADLLLRNGRIALLHSVEIIDGDVAITQNRIVAVGCVDEALVAGSTVEIDLQRGYVSPGLFDPHFHVGGSHLNMTELARALLPRGTTSIATDMQEAYTYAGPEGVRAFLDEARAAGLRAFLIPSVHVLGLEDIGTFRWPVSGDDMAAMVAWPEAIGINEPPPSPVLAKHPGVMQAITATKAVGKRLPGHAPGIHGASLQAYVAAGFNACHESTTPEEALEKLRLGMHVMARDGSASPDLLALLELTRTHPASARFTMLCSDEEDPSDLLTVGHMDDKLRKTVGYGIDPVIALQMASLNAATYFGLDADLGAVTPGRLADLVIFDDLTAFQPRMVISGGRIVARDGAMVDAAEPVSRPESLRSRVAFPRRLEARDFAMASDRSEVEVRVLEVSDGTLVSRAGTRTLGSLVDAVGGDVRNDILKMAVIDRHSGSDRMGLGLVHGLGFQGGAVATTYCHVHYNLLTVGTSDAEMAHAANVVRDIGGGMAVVRNGEILAVWELPIVGIFSEQSLADSRDSFVEMNAAIRSLGCSFRAPVLALSFVALPTIPAYGLTDLGLIDVVTQQLVDITLPAASGGSH